MRGVLVDTIEAFIQMEADIGYRELIAVDCETTMLDQYSKEFEVVGFSIAGDQRTGYYIPINHIVRKGKEEEGVRNIDPGWAMNRLSKLLKGRKIAGAHFKFDKQAFAKYGADIGVLAYDVLLAASVDDTRGYRYGLKDLTKVRLEYKRPEFNSVVAKVKPKKQRRKKTEIDEDDATDEGGKKRSKKERSWFELLTPNEAVEYAAFDAVDVLRIKPIIDSSINRDNKLKDLLKLEVEVSKVLSEMESTGLLLDRVVVKALYDEAEDRELKAVSTMSSISGIDINPRSNKEMGDLLYHTWGIRHPTGKSYRKGQAPPRGWMDRKAMEDLLLIVRSSPKPTYNATPKDKVIEFLEAKIKFSKFGKFRSTYTLSLIDLCSDDGRLHTSFRQIISSGRLSSSSPNLQNIPRADDIDMSGLDVRSAFVPDPGYVFVKADYSGQEMRAIAGYSQDPTLVGIMTGATRDENGNEIDIHAYVGYKAFNVSYADIIKAKKKKERIEAGADEVMSEEDKRLVKIRQDSKPVNFGIAYGETEHGLAKTLKQSVEFSRQILDAWRTKAFPKAWEWLESIPKQALHNLEVRTAMGRRRKISPRSRGVDSRVLQNISRSWQNYPIQGLAADMMKHAMVRVYNRLKKQFGNNAKLALQIHDELVVLCKEEYAEACMKVLEEEMTTELMGIPFPVEGKICVNLSK